MSVSVGSILGDFFCVCFTVCLLPVFVRATQTQVRFLYLTRMIFKNCTACLEIYETGDLHKLHLSWHRQNYIVVWKLCLVRFVLPFIIKCSKFKCLLGSDYGNEKWELCVTCYDYHCDFIFLCTFFSSFYALSFQGLWTGYSQSGWKLHPLYQFVW